VQVSYEARSGAVLYVKDVERVAAYYAAVLGLQPGDRDDDHVVLESPQSQLVVLRIPKAIAASIEIAVPPVRRTRTPVKLVFFVPSLAAARVSAGAFGGVVDPVETEWMFQGFKVCDGHDPEGNVIQLREDTRPNRP